MPDIIIFKHQADPDIVERGALRTLTDGLADYPVVLLRGSRMVGKTTLARQVINSEWSLFNAQHRALFERDAQTVLLESPKPVLVDEWQAFPEVVLTVKDLVDRKLLSGVILAGSAEPREDAWGLTTQFPLGGRSKSISLWPLSIAERKGTHRPTLAEELFAGSVPTTPEILTHQQYLDLVFESGYPATLGKSAASARRHLRDVASASIRQTLRPAHDVDEGTESRRTDVTHAGLMRFVEVYASQSGRSTTMNKLAKRTSSHPRTAQRYADLLAQSHLVCAAPTWRRLASMLPTTQMKLFVAEAAMIPALTRTTDANLIADDVLLGGAIETFVNAQLLALRTASSVNFAIEAYELPRGSRRSAGPTDTSDAAQFPANEIDFLLRTTDEKPERVVAIEVKAAKHPDVKHLDKLAALRDAFDHLRRGDPTAPLFGAGLLLGCGDISTQRVSDRLWIAPLSVLWA